MGNIKIINRVFPVILFHVVDFSNSELLPRTPWKRKSALHINNVCIKILSSSPENYFILLAFFVSPKKKRMKSFTHLLIIYLFKISSQSHILKSIAPVLISLHGKVSIKTPQVSIFCKKKKKKRKRVKVSKNPLSLG